jgi:RNA polymerase sigma-70 factor (ECF subfamily)
MDAALTPAPAGCTGAEADAPSDAVLVDAARRGDYSAFETVVRRHHGRVFRMAQGMTRSADEAQEVAQDTFLQVFRGLAGFKGRSSLGSWIYQIAVNAALTRLRQKRRRPAVSLETTDELTPHAPDALMESSARWARPADERLLDQELAQRMAKAMEDLPDKYRMVLLLRDVEGQSAEEVAQTFGLTVPTVKARLHRARLAVRRHMHPYLNL